MIFAFCVEILMPFRSASHWAGVMGAEDNLWTVYCFKLAECPEQEMQWVSLWFLRFFKPIYETLCRPHKTCSTCMFTTLGVVSGCFKNEVPRPFVSYVTSHSEARQPDSEEHTGLKKKVQNFWKVASSMRQSEQAGEWVSQSFNNIMAEKCYPEIPEPELLQGLTFPSQLHQATLKNTIDLSFHLCCGMIWL